MPLLEDFTMREDQTETITFTLQYGGPHGGRPRDLTGVNKVALSIIPSGGTGSIATINTTDHSTKIAISAATSGEVTWTPAAGDVLQASSPYLYFFFVYVTASVIEAYPNHKEVYIRVLKGL